MSVLAATLGRNISDFFINKKGSELRVDAHFFANAFEVLLVAIRMYCASVIPVFVRLNLLNKDDVDGDVVRFAVGVAHFALIGGAVC